MIMRDVIPGWLRSSEGKILYHLALPYNHENTVGIEIGSFCGRSSAILAQAINKGKLYCLDLWDGFKHKTSVRVKNALYFPVHGINNTLENFLEHTAEYSNIIPIKGKSPQSVMDWDIPVDFIFLDALHVNPSDRENIDFWLPKIKLGGKFIGHDYDPRYPDVIENVRYLEGILNKSVHISESIWYFDI